MRAVADALATEYRAIVERGLLLQIDAPDLAIERHTLFADRPLRDFLAGSSSSSDAINRPSRGYPRDGPTARLLGELRGPAHARRRLDEILPLLYGRKWARSCSRWRTRATRTSTLLRAAAAARRHGARGRRDRHDEQLRGAPAGRRRSADHVAAAVGDRARARRHGLRLRHRRGHRRGRDRLVWDKLRALSEGAAGSRRPRRSELRSALD